MATSKLGFAGRVAVITGAGGGLGRAYAIEFASRGASVVVNDLGSTFRGEGKGTQLADQVVEEIIAAGGKAVANYDSVEEGDKIIDSAIKNFGKVDIVINNAGILRDRSFLKLPDEDWDKIFQVHVKGAFKVTKAAWPHMQKQRYGRVIMTTSPAGLYGNFGQSNYSAAKMALVGLANTLSIEGRKANINVNTIAPLAVTRMTEDIMPGAGLKPEHVAPFVVYLCHESCSDTGTIVEAAGGFACKNRLQRSQGIQLRRFINDNPTVEMVADSWHQLGDFSLSSAPANVTEASTPIMASIQNLPEHPIPENASAIEKMKAFRFPDSIFIYTVDDVIRYALSIGADLPQDSQYLYEGHSEFQVVPSFAAIMGQGSAFGHFAGGIPGFEDIDLARSVHGEQYSEIFKPIPTSGKVTSRTRIVDALDKRKFCQVIIENEIFDESGNKLCRNQFVALFLGSGGVGRRGKAEVQIPSLPPPKRAPDAVCEEKTMTNQAALYRLNGDKNPLHIDPNFSAAMGFPQPILHGLCTYGYALRHVIKTYANNDSTLFKAIKAQFSKPVLPGQTLVTEMWLEGRRVHFQTKVKETNEVVIKGAYVDLNADAKQHSAASAFQATPTVPSNKSSNLKADVIFTELSKVLGSSPDLVHSVNGSFLFQILKDGAVAGEYYLDFKSSPPSITSGTLSKKADVTIKVSDDDFVLLAEEKLNSLNAFMQGKIKVSGKIMLAQKLGDVFKAYGKNKSNESQATPATEAETTDKSLKASSIMEEIKTRMKTFPDLMQKVKGSFLIQITKANKLAGEWLINFNDSPAVIAYGPPSSKPDVTIKMEDDDFQTLATGKLNPMTAFMQGKLKATGKIMLAQKLGDLFSTHAAKL